jgi:P27 family predicted phage terminase small subunit
LKVVQGKPGHRALPENEPMPEALEAPPEPPVHLSGLARAEWDRTYPVLARNRLITEADVTAFSAYCQAYGRWQEAEELVSKQGIMILSPTNFPMQHPALAVANKAMEQIAKFCAEFGMTPSSRTRVQVGSKAGKGNAFANLRGKTAAGKRSA